MNCVIITVGLTLSKFSSCSASRSAEYSAHRCCAGEQVSLPSTGGGPIGALIRIFLSGAFRLVH
eukprot:4454056-Pyramimonas_sp.AAC.1